MIISLDAAERTAQLLVGSTNAARWNRHEAGSLAIVDADGVRVGPDRAELTLYAVPTAEVGGSLRSVYWAELEPADVVMGRKPRVKRGPSPLAIAIDALFQDRGAGPPPAIYHPFAPRAGVLPAGTLLYRLDDGTLATFNPATGAYTPIDP